MAESTSKCSIYRLGGGDLDSGIPQGIITFEYMPSYQPNVCDMNVPP